MFIDRKIAHAPKTNAFAQEVAASQAQCIGCTDCKGMCTALIDAMMIPEIITQKATAQ